MAIVKPGKAYDDAVNTLVLYFSCLADRANLQWAEKQESDMRNLVKNIMAAAADEAIRRVKLETNPLKVVTAPQSVPQTAPLNGAIGCQAKEDHEQGEA
jgi:hypothetical protein